MLTYLVEHGASVIILDLISEYKDEFIRLCNIPVQMSILHALAMKNAEFDEHEKKLFEFCANSTNVTVRNKF